MLTHSTENIWSVQFIIFGKSHYNKRMTSSKVLHRLNRPNKAIATSKREREKSIAYAAILTAAEAAEKAAAFFRCVFMVKLFPFTIVF